MTITIHRDLVQGGDEWLATRCGRLTASEMHLILTPTLKPAQNDKSRAHLYELLAQRITSHVEPRFISDDMARGQADEIEARALYASHFARVEEVGFITREITDGITIGYSPDGIVGDDGLIECKSRRQKFQAATILANEVPAEHVLQCQTGLLVTGRAWLDYVSYCAGMPMAVIRVWPDDVIHAAIVEAASVFEDAMAERMAEYRAALAADGARLIPTERRIETEIFA